MSSPALERAGGQQRVQGGAGVGVRVGRGPEQGQVLRERAGRERRRRTGRLVAEHLALAVDEPAQDTTAHHVEDGLARQAERVATGESPAQRRQRVAEDPVGDELEPGRLGRTAEHQRLAQQPQHGLDLGRRLATGEDRQPAGCDGGGRTHDGRVQVRRAGRRDQRLQLRRLVGTDGGGVDDGRPGRQRRHACGEHLAAGLAVVQAEQHYVGALHRDRRRAAAAPGPRADVVVVGEAGGDGRAHPAESEHSNRGHAHQPGSGTDMRQAQIMHPLHALPS